MKESEKIFMNQKGYEEFLKEIEKLKTRLTEINMGRKDAFEAGAGDGWDSPEFEEIERQERMVLGELQSRYKTLSKIVIVERKENDELIDIGDIVKIDMIYSEDDREETTFKLVAASPKIDLNATIREISINSPIGKAMYRNKIGTTATYNVNGRAFTFEIKEKIDLTKENEETSKKLTK